MWLYTTSSSRPSKTSPNGTGPSAPMTVVSGGTSVMGSRRRAAAIASPSRVCAFSRLRSSRSCRSKSSWSVTGGADVVIVSSFGCLGGRILVTRVPGLTVPAVPQLEEPVTGCGAGDRLEPVGLGDAREQPGALARNVREQAQLELVDQVEPHERTPEADAAPDHDVAVAALPELVDLLCRVTCGDRGVGPVGRPQGPGEDDLARGVQDRGEGVVGGRCCHGLGDGLVGGAAHDVRVRAPEKVELRRVAGLTVLGQAEAELPKVGALVGEKAVERVVEHRRYQLPHDQTSFVSGRLGTVLATRTRLFRAAALAWPRRLWPVAIASDATAARKSSVPRQPAGCAEGR